MKKNNFFNKIKQSKEIIDKTKEKRKSTMDKYKSIAEIQRFVDLSDEKRNLLIQTIKNTKTDKSILEKGVLVYVKLLEVIEAIEKDLEENGIDFKTITGKVLANKRTKIIDWFNSDSKDKILLISDAGGESLNIKATNEIILYNTPDGWRANTQTIGRVDRGGFDCVNVHIIQVEDSIDIFKSILISSKKQLELELLHCDYVDLNEVSSFNSYILKSFRKRLLWKS